MNRTGRVALATTTAARGLDEDMPLLEAALVDLGLATRQLDWHDATATLADDDLVVVRSTWDYFARRDEFLAWAEQVAAATALHNPPPVLAWNSDKRYLAELARAGVTIVPTRFFAPGDPVTLDPAEDRIVKPAVSAGSNDTARYPASETEAAAAHVARLHAAGRVAMVQPYQHAVDTRGETALLYFDGRFSHAIEKGAIFASGPQMVGGLYAREEIRPRTPSPAERAAGETVLAALAEAAPHLALPLLYARVDLVPLADGTPGLLELELCEPSTFLAHAEGAAARFARAIAARMR